MTSLPTLCSFLCCSAVLAACSKPSPTAVGPDTAVSVPTASATAAPLTSAPTPEAKAPEKTASYDVNTKSITAKSGTHFALLLPATISTPMKWRMQPAPDAAVLTVAGETYTEAPPADCAGCTGYPGTKRFEFEAHAAGKQTLHLAYGSLTDPSAKPEKELSIDVSVE